MFGNALLCLFSFSQILELQFNASTSTSFNWRNAEKLASNIIIFIANFFGVAAYHVCNTYPTDICFLITQSVQLRSAKNFQGDGSQSRGTVKLLFVYFTVVIPIIGFTLHFGAPFLRPYDPVQAYFADCDPSWVLKIVGSLVLGIPTSLSIILIYQCVIGIIFIGDTAFLLSKAMYHGLPVIHSAQEYILKRTAFHFSTVSRPNVAQNLVRRFRINCFQFKRYWSVYRQFQILICICNSISDFILTTLLVFGGALFVTCFFMVVKLHDNIPLLVNISAVVFIVVFEAIMAILLFLGAVPHERSKMFKTFWRHLLKTKVERKQLDSCKVLGFSAGPIRVAKSRTVLDLNNVLINATASLVLMRN